MPKPERLLAHPTTIPQRPTMFTCPNSNPMGLHPPTQMLLTRKISRTGGGLSDKLREAAGLKIKWRPTLFVYFFELLSNGKLFFYLIGLHYLNVQN